MTNSSAHIQTEANSFPAKAGTNLGVSIESEPEDIRRQVFDTGSRVSARSAYQVRVLALPHLVVSFYLGSLVPAVH